MELEEELLGVLGGTASSSSLSNNKKPLKKVSINPIPALIFFFPKKIKKIQKSKKKKKKNLRTTPN